MAWSTKRKIGLCCFFASPFTSLAIRLTCPQPRKILNPVHAGRGSNWGVTTSKRQDHDGVTVLIAGSRCFRSPRLLLRSRRRSRAYFVQSASTRDKDHVIVRQQLHDLSRGGQRAERFIDWATRAVVCRNHKSGNARCVRRFTRCSSTYLCRLKFELKAGDC